MEATSNTNTPMLTIAEAATFLNVSRATIRRWTNDGRLKCSRIGPREERRFRQVDLLELVKQPQAEIRERSGLPAEAPPANSSCAEPAHCCMISNDIQEEWATLGPEILKRLGQGAQVLVIEDSDRSKRLDNLLAENGLNKRELVATHALRRVSIEESYFLSGTMQWDRAVAFVESAILEAKARGFNNILVIGTGSWVTDLHAEGVVDELRKYELGLDRMLSRHPGASVLCPYAATQVSAQMIVQAFATHPVVQIHSTIMPGLLERPAYR